MEITEELAIKVRDTVACGLTAGIGDNIAGKMCVEAAVCFAMGLPHSDNPPCVGKAVRAFKIRLNDSWWSSDEARAEGMKKIAIAQLGSNNIDQKEFTKRLIVKISNTFLADLAKEHYPSLEDRLRTTSDLHELSKLCNQLRTENFKYTGAPADIVEFAINKLEVMSPSVAAIQMAAVPIYISHHIDIRIHSKADALYTAAADLCLETLQEMNCEGTKYLYLLN